MTQKHVLQPEEDLLEHLVLRNVVFLVELHRRLVYQGTSLAHFLVDPLGVLVGLHQLLAQVAQACLLFFVPADVARDCARCLVVAVVEELQRRRDLQVHLQLPGGHLCSDGLQFVELQNVASPELDISTAGN